MVTYEPLTNLGSLWYLSMLICHFHPMALAKDVNEKNSVWVPFIPSDEKI